MSNGLERLPSCFCIISKIAIFYQLLLFDVLENYVLQQYSPGSFVTEDTDAIVLTTMPILFPLFLGIDFEESIQIPLQ